MVHTILLTGGAGFIGSHTAIQLANTGRYKVVIVDNFANSCMAAVDAVRKLCPESSVEFHNIDISTDVEKLKALKFEGVVHFAALKAVGESVAQPLMYYRNNINCMINVIEAAKHVGAKYFVFSSSATVYQPAEGLLTEQHPLGPSNPYGQTKFMGEQILKDLWVSDHDWKIISLRYFNPIGAHESGTIGEDASKASNLMPCIHRALFMNQRLQVFGDDWPTVDGTGVRDYVHVVDLADGHVAALDGLFGYKEGRYNVYNLGTGRGASVKELMNAFEKASGQKIDHFIGPRRPGDLATVIADPSKAEKELGFKTKRTIEQACADSWKWMSAYPHGFDVKK
ncbi:UDP-glucose 4-epimerase [Gregarina niphandrodes]|uniref:UDP-glucose 4-epimerase n=1 Tax=Gregarina niphandrodes TaxID=110365 RepID=A0A023B4J6_GRENI|nr:UDP-glucose 4-epimerase [Gregarina niphandrodes]EZG56486.1 UDP-glucose 4-epimerase [Gregarina niphandrodes]|eukprot:XP_011131261.1 UDP-glucose 4-epimerase [Gregarina niphandrodes]